MKMNITSISSTLSPDYILQSNIPKYTAAITLTVLSFGFAPTAAAISTFDGSAAITITLESVTDVEGMTVEAAGNWSVIAGGSEDPPFTGVVGDATVGVTNSFVPHAVLNIGDGVSQASHSGGSATNGSSFADALTSLYIDVENTYAGSLNFNFSFSAMAAATVVGGATIDDYAGSAVLVFDDLGYDYVDIFTDVSIDGTDNPPLLTGTIGFELMDADANTISAFVDSYGQIAATAPTGPPVSAVPVPAAVWLFGSGLIGLIGVARRKK
jgi:hypothetical protein